MIFNRKNTVIALFSASLLVFASCKDQAKIDADMKAAEEKVEMEMAAAKKLEEEAAAKKMMTTSIVGLAAANDELSMLVSAVKAANLDTMLSAPGAYTVFAPTNNAFEKLPKNLSVAELAKPENKELLTAVLQYHVVPGVIDSEQLVEAIKGAKGSYTFATAGGAELTATMKGETIILKDAKGTKTQIISGNIKASNGMVHVINDVLMPTK